MASSRLGSVASLLFLMLYKCVSSDQYVDCRSQSCRRSYILCADHENCEIDCGFSNEACQSSIMICPVNANCKIKCDTIEACDRATIYAEDSNLLDLQCIGHNQSCRFLNVHCPQFKGSKACTISGFDGIYFIIFTYCMYINGNLSFLDFFEMAVYAINGFDDVQFNIQSILPSTTILCSSTASEFDESCTVSPTFPHNQCIDDPLSCNPTNPPTQTPSTFPTKIPSVSPTNHPTSNPSTPPTVLPSKMPSVFPTATPTNDPTSYPTKNPSKSPSNFPTKRPSNEPSVVPTIHPTITPSKEPTVCNLYQRMKQLHIRNEIGSEHQSDAYSNI